MVLCGYYLSATVLMLNTLSTTAVNTHLYNVLYVLTSLAMAYYYSALLTSTWKRGITVLVGGVTLTYFAANILLGNDKLFDSNGYVITSTGVVLLIFLYLHQIFSNITEEQLSLKFDFWFVCSQLIYHLGAFGIFLTYHRLTEKVIDANYLHENRLILTYLWGIHNVLLFLGALLTCSGLIWIIYRKKSPSS